MASQRWQNKLPKYITFAVIACGLAACSYFHTFDSYELETLDLRYQLRPPQNVTDKIVFIDIDEYTLSALGSYPFPREDHANLVRYLRDSGVKYILFDILFVEPQKDRFKSDLKFRAAMAQAGNVYLPYALMPSEKQTGNVFTATDYLAKTLPALRSAAYGEGHINITPDVDGKYRRVPLYIRFKDSLRPYISFQVAVDYMGIPQEEIRFIPGKSIKIGNAVSVPLDDKSNMIINYSGKWGGQYQHISYVQVFESYLAQLDGRRGSVDLNKLRGKICIIAPVASGLCDLHPTPLERLYPAAGIHADVINSIMNNSFIRRASQLQNLFALLGLALIISLVTLYMRPIRGLSILILMTILYSVYSAYLFNYFGLWIDLFFPIMMMALVYLSLTLYKYITEWKRRLLIENELSIAKKIQQSFLPKALPTLPDAEIAVAMFTARQVGGDLYDFLNFGPDKVGIMMGDVSGKGVPASLFMAMVIGSLKFFATSDARPDQVLEKLNLQLIKEASSNLFVTMYYLIYNHKTKIIEYSNGGHLPLLRLAHNSQKVEFFDTKDGAPLGLIEGPYSTSSFNYENGDILVMYTDGVTEAMNNRGEMYEKERLAESVIKHRSLPPKELLNAIERDLRKFEPPSKQHDDITIMVIKISKSGEGIQ